MCAHHNDFTHLHVHSHYSLLDGLSKVSDLVKKAKEFGMTALALTDHGAMYGAIDFYKSCKKADIKPIIGVEAYVANRTRFDRDPTIDNKRYHLTLLARNIAGYKNLMKMTSKAHLEGFYYKPRIDKELLKEHADGLIILSGCPGSEFIQLVKEHYYDKAKELLEYYISCVGRDHVFVEIMNHTEAPGLDWYLDLLPKIKEIADEVQLPLVATWDSHYLCVDDNTAHETLLKINTGGSTMKMDGNWSFINQETVCEIFKDYPEAVANTKKVADLVDIEIDTTSWFFPSFPIAEGETYDSVLRKMVFEGIKTRNIPETPELFERIEYELKTISDKGYPSYFLCVADFMKSSTELGIYNQTRGSAAGSLVAYLIGISNINPLQYGLLFERFLNPDRPSLPDIDMDFADNRRDDIIKYAREKYGDAAVAQIGTFGTMAARGAVRDVARALGFPYALGDKISKMIPMGSQGFAMTLDRALAEEPELKELYEGDRQVAEIIDMAKKIEGNVRHISVHAAGVVISPTGHVDDFSPVQYDPKGEGKVITQYDMYSGDREGIINLPKFDFLGLRNLTILKEAVTRIEKIRGVVIDVETIPLDDAQTYELFGRGETVSIFQFGSTGMQKWLKELQPSNLEDLIAMASLYRPGPMAFIPDYIERKHDPSKIQYADDRMEPILKNTYGIIVYQEDVMRMATDLAGYTRGESDKFRKAVGKKIPEEMAKQKGRFIDGCIENGMKKNVAQELWDMIETFAAYGFNKSHSAVYALLAYRTAYLKAHYPAEYMTAVLTIESDNLDTITEMINESKRMGFQILPPDINESFSDFSVVVENGTVTNKIRFGLGSIKNFGNEIGKAIITERKARGPFQSIEDFLKRVFHRNLTKKSLEALIMCGAFDQLGDRGHLLANMENMLNFNKLLHEDINKGVESLFAELDDAPEARLVLIDAQPTPKKQMLAWEKELLGQYVSGHPLDDYRETFEKAGSSIKKLKDPKLIGSTQVVAGIIEDVREIYTKKNNDKMAFIRLKDLDDTIECVVFPKTFVLVRNLCVTEKLVMIKGKVTDRDGTHSVIIDEIRELT
jgi:DNA polymerase III subunit alpha